MERHKCKLCSKCFANGRALGGHMKSHLSAFPLPPKVKPEQQLGDRTESTSSLSSSTEEEKEEVKESEEKVLVYGLRENPRKSFRLVDPEFLDAGSVVQDRESETESIRNPTRKRSKRTRKMCVGESGNERTTKKKMIKQSSTESTAKLELVSSVSETSPEEDVALCLMMLSRDAWSSDNSEETMKPSRTTRGKHRCETCSRVFGSFQALGGHRTSHSKNRNCPEDQDHEGDETEQQKRNVVTKNVDQKKRHECPVCGKLFGSGQALGGHKRSHHLASSTTSPTSPKLAANCSDKCRENLIDLNLPAQLEDEDLSQLELSAVSDAEFVNHI